MLRFQGSLNDLQELMMRCVILGEWNFHKKSRFNRFQAAAGAILNWWPKTGRLFLEHALVGPAQSGPAVVCEESAWAAVPGPTPRQDGSREAPSFAGTESRRNPASHPSPRLIPRTIKLLAPPDRG